MGVEHSFDVDIAEKYGIQAAIMLKNIYYWTTLNKANERNYQDGRYWTHNSVKALRELFPYISTRSMRSTLDKLIDLGLIIKGNYNKSAYDRTLWYALTDKGLSICQKGQMDLPDEQNGVDAKGEPIPDINPDINTDNPPIAPQGAERAADGDDKPKPKRKRAAKAVPYCEPEMFERFWALYPRGEDRQGAVREWDKLSPDRELMQTMSAALRRQMESEDWRRGIGIPYACRWLSKRRWEDEKREPVGKAEYSGGWAEAREVL